MILPQPKLERRLQNRYHKLVLEHVNVNSEIAAGPRALPGKGKAFSSTQGAWRYYANPFTAHQRPDGNAVGDARTEPDL